MFLLLDKIHSCYEHIDILLHNYSYNYDYLRNCEIEFKNLETNEVLFTYFYEADNAVQSIFVGTLAKVSNGWKFYPVFEEYEDDLKDVIKKYKEML